MARFRGGRSRMGRGGGRGQRRRMDWYQARLQEQALATATIAASWALLPSEADFLTDPTLIRTLLHSYVRNPGSTVGHVVVGIIAWDNPDDTVPANPPDPVSEGYLDWIIRHVHPMMGNTTGSTYPQVEGQFDVRAMRRLGNTKGILIVTGNATAGTVNWGVDARLLLKE